MIAPPAAASGVYVASDGPGRLPLAADRGARDQLDDSARSWPRSTQRARKSLHSAGMAAASMTGLSPAVEIRAIRRAAVMKIRAQRSRERTASCT